MPMVLELMMSFRYKFEMLSICPGKGLNCHGEIDRIRSRILSNFIKFLNFYTLSEKVIFTPLFI